MEKKPFVELSPFVLGTAKATSKNNELFPLVCYAFPYYLRAPLPVSCSLFLMLAGFVVWGLGYSVAQGFLTRSWSCRPVADSQVDRLEDWIVVLGLHSLTLGLQRHRMPLLKATHSRTSRVIRLEVEHLKSSSLCLLVVFVVEWRTLLLMRWVSFVGLHFLLGIYPYYVFELKLNPNNIVHTFGILFA